MLRYSIIFVVLLCQGCDQNNNTAKMQAMEGEIAALKSTLDALQSKVYANQFDLITKLPDQVDLDPAKREYLTYRDQLVSLAIAVDSVQAQADGTRAVINFGNPQQVELVNVSIHVEYGIRSPDKYTPESYETWKSSLKSTDLDLTCTVFAGAWNPCSIELPGVKPENLGYISISKITYKSINLRRGITQ
jgi:hypothetical protein